MWNKRVDTMWKIKILKYRCHENRNKNKYYSYYWVGINSGDI